jgi:hypothetical protein
MRPTEFNNSGLMRVHGGRNFFSLLYFFPRKKLRFIKLALGKVSATDRSRTKVPNSNFLWIAQGTCGFIETK